MKKYLKQMIEEMFEGCTPLQVIKQIVGVFIAIFVLIVISGADSIGAGNVVICLGIAAILWKYFNLNDAFPNDKK
jgi:hypothetical protein